MHNYNYGLYRLIWEGPQMNDTKCEVGRCKQKWLTLCHTLISQLSYNHVVLESRYTNLLIYNDSADPSSYNEECMSISTSWSGFWNIQDTPKGPEFTSSWHQALYKFKQAVTINYMHRGTPLVIRWRVLCVVEHVDVTSSSNLSRGMNRQIQTRWCIRVAESWNDPHTTALHNKSLQCEWGRSLVIFKVCTTGPYVSQNITLLQ